MQVPFQAVCSGTGPTPPKRMCMCTASAHNKIDEGHTHGTSTHTMGCCAMREVHVILTWGAGNACCFHFKRRHSVHYSKDYFPLKVGPVFCLYIYLVLGFGRFWTDSRGPIRNQ